MSSFFGSVQLNIGRIEQMLKLLICAALFLTACAGQKQTICLKVREFSDVKIQYLEKKTTVVIQDSTGQLIIISNTAINE